MLDVRWECKWLGADVDDPDPTFGFLGITPLQRNSKGFVSLEPLGLMCSTS